MDELAHRNRKDPLARVLLIVAGLLALLSVYQLAALTAAAKPVALALPPEPPAAEKQAQFAADKSVAGTLKKKNLFKMEEPPRNPVTEIAGILGNEALINGQWYKVGAKVGDPKNPAVIVAVEPTKVRVKWNGKETDFLPINAVGAPSSPTARGPEGGPSGPRGEGPRGMSSVVRSGSSGPAPSAAAGARRTISAEQMNALSQRMRNASSPEERRQIAEEQRRLVTGQ